MKVRVLCLFGFLLLFIACNGQQAKKAETESTKKRTFEMVAVPSVITEPAERAEYLAKHYWDKFDFSDTTLIHLPELTEQASSNFIDMMKYVSPEVAATSIKSMMNKAAVDSTMFAYFANLYEKYLYDPNSPMRDETLYISVLQSVLDARVFDEVHKIRPAHLLELAMKNKVGEPAADITYTLANGQKGNLYQIKADKTVLFFNNPDCHACKEITDQLAASPVVNEWIKQNKLKVLAVYPDEDLEAWKNHISYMPKDWINSYDATLSMRNDETYDLKAIPTLYLLDKDKKVILKDITFNQIIEYLQKQAK